VYKLLTIQALNKYVAKKQRKLRASINKPYNVIIIMFKLVGTPFANNKNTLFKRNCHEVYQNYGTLCHYIGQVRAQNILTCVAKRGNLFC